MSSVPCVCGSPIEVEGSAHPGVGPPGVLEGDDIETTDAVVSMCGEVVLRCASQAYLFFCCDRGCGVGVATACAQPHLDKHQTALVLHDQIDLAESAAIVARDQAQAVALQVDCGNPLRQVPTTVVLGPQRGGFGQTQRAYCSLPVSSRWRRKRPPLSSHRRPLAAFTLRLDVGSSSGSQVASANASKPKA